MKRAALIASVLLFLAMPASAATLYMGSGETYTNLQAAFAAMSGGDTLIIRAGTYTGASNIITQTNYPPYGSAGAYTKIKAETNGAVYFGDPDSATSYLDMTGYMGGSAQNVYWEFTGIVWNTLTNIYGANYTKFFHCGSGTNTADQAVNFMTYYTDYALYEDCYAWGGGRYKFLAYQSSHIIFRRCVGRTDAVTSSMPIGGFGFYYASNCEAQNCILIDSDTIAQWTYESLVGVFTEPNGTGSNNFFRGCIALNCTMPLHFITAGQTNSTRQNIIGWDIYSGSLLRASGTTISHATIGDIGTALAEYSTVHNFEGTTSITNSILTGIAVQNAVYGVTSNYNSYYNNNSNFGGGTSAGANDITATNPLAASLRYLPRIESSTALSGAASDSGDIGATVLKRIGTSGTLWGETGYATTTNDDLWPWPGEDNIKTKFTGYSHAGITAARGFATGTSIDGSAQTLTKYIWEYLGNEIPCGIYGCRHAVDGGTFSGGAVR